MVDVNVQTDPLLPATVIGVEQDILIGERVRKSFGSRTFWGSVVSCYWISGGLFYKLSFDDGDVDILSSDEVLQDIAAARKHLKENQNVVAKGVSIDETTSVDDYFMTMRRHNLKRRRDDAVGSTAICTRRVHLWGQRLYASIYTNMQNETFIREMLKTDDGEMGEMEATGQVEVGDIILAVNKTRVLGMASARLAELMRKQKRPITLTFYRPQHSETSKKLQEQHVKRSLASSKVHDANAQTPPMQQNSLQVQAVPLTHHATTIPRQKANASMSGVMPSSSSASLLTFTQPSSMVGSIADPLIQQSSMSQTHGLLAKEKLRQRLNQNSIMAAGQTSYMPGYPTTGIFGHRNVVSACGVSPVHVGARQPHQVQMMQNVINAAPVRLASGSAVPTAQLARPIRPAPLDRNHGPTQRQHTGPVASNQACQVNAVHGPSGHISGQRQPSASTTKPSKEPNKSSVVSVVGLGRQSTSLQPEKGQPEASTTSQNTFSHKLTSDQNFVVGTSCENVTTTSTLVSPTPTIGTSMVKTRDAETIARLAETDSKAAERAMSRAILTASLVSPNKAAQKVIGGTTSPLSASSPGDEDQAATKCKTSGSSDSMSFLSPNGSSIEASMLPHRNVPAGVPANNLAEVKSNVSLMTVTVSRRRLYLTLGFQGIFIAVTSFILDEFGQPGEVQASGKVFIGDILVRINQISISAGLTPGHVANIVNGSPRPMTLWFKRASWDILNGKV
ncbi:unnamed protein product [Peronospora belbahrii]|uniref:PDZ domain-containing protein n=1 Tax=Peronospora belbahrii TaxID=622444 RepID=A0ABN8CP11_9STRA|nr:unnamed protein product [Peronospora belbahrii]